MEQQSLLTDIEFNPVLASVGKRFLNYVVDVIVYYLFSILYGIVLALSGKAYLATDDDYEIIIVLTLVILFLLYYFLTEYLKGRTLGKLVTGTKVVNEDGSAPSAKTCLLRTLCRLVPFEFISTFSGLPWHDKWTHTYVIDVKKTDLNNASSL